jgi:integrase family protein with SAM-like domain
LAKRKEESTVGHMTPQEKKSTIQSLALYKQTLEGNNYAPQSIKAYLGDVEQFVAWLQTRRVDWDIPYRIQRIDIVEFINNLGAKKASAVTRKRKLAAIRGFPAISGDLLSAVISTYYIFGFRKDNPNVFNNLIQNWPHF